MSQYQANPCEGHLEPLYLIVHFLSNNPMKRLVFDPSLPGVNEQAFQVDVDWTEFYGDIEEEECRNHWGDRYKLLHSWMLIMLQHSDQEVPLGHFHLRKMQ